MGGNGGSAKAGADMASTSDKTLNLNFKILDKFCMPLTIRILLPGLKAQQIPVHGLDNLNASRDNDSLDKRIDNPRPSWGR